MARQSRIDARAGVHIGEFDANCSDVPLMAMAATIAEGAAVHEVNASRTVIDLLAGAGFRFDDRGHVNATDGKPVGVLSVTDVERHDGRPGPR
jgi:hypothetical protein